MTDCVWKGETPKTSARNGTFNSKSLEFRFFFPPYLFERHTQQQTTTKHLEFPKHPREMALLTRNHRILVFVFPPYSQQKKTTKQVFGQPWKQVFDHQSLKTYPESTGLVLLGELVKDGPSMLFAWDPQHHAGEWMARWWCSNQKSPKAVSFPTTVLDGAKNPW